MIQVIRVENQAEGGQQALAILKEKLAAGAQTLGLATGSSPVGFYEAVRASDVDFSELTSVNLDEYVGLAADNPQSYRYFMEEHLFQAKPFKANYLPNGEAADLDAELSRYQEILEAHPVDLQILGIGRNGHIGFNEPGTSFDQTTQVVDLEPSTIEANARFFDKIEDVPTKAISMGIKNIMEAKAIILFAYGADKAAAIAGALQGPVTEDLPASILQKHPEVYIFADDAALAELEG